MNSLFEWMVFGETMSFYGVARDRLASVETDSECSPCVRVTVSTGFALDGADRPIGVWCVPPVTNPVCRNRKMKRSRNPESPMRTRVSSERNPLLSRVTRPWNLDQRLLAIQRSGESKKPGNKRDEEGALS